MLSRLAIALTAAAALAGGVIATAAPTQAQTFNSPGFSITIGSGHDYYRPAGGPHGWGPPPHAYGPRGYGRPHHYGHPGWGHGGGYGRRCWRQPVDVWNGWGYERRWQKV
ncbi:MAG: hypothetical protein ACRCWO_08870, partial [Bosea sp. (in: a-proteobacteria)]